MDDSKLEESNYKAKLRAYENISFMQNCFFGIIGLITFVLYFYKATRINPTPPPDYSLEIKGDYLFPVVIKEYGIEFYVKYSSHVFNQNYPLGTPERADIENTIITDYTHLVQEYCAYELRRPDFETPLCDKFRSLGKHQDFRQDFPTFFKDH